jgi:hypothetical protein
VSFHKTLDRVNVSKRNPLSQNHGMKTRRFSQTKLFDNKLQTNV